ncbi:MAG: hypothetical protein QXG98_03985 [Candidatus Micrarchaeia archaeon]
MPIKRKGEKWDVPPRVKVLEALGSIADNRVKIAGNAATVVSSLGERAYRVMWDGARGIFSDDNGSLWQGYLGYPAIAFLMLKNQLPFEARLANSLKGIPWKELNRRFRNDYSKTEAEAFRLASAKGVSARELELFAEKVLAEIRKAGFVRL